MSTKQTQFPKKQKGQSLVEVALFLPILVILVAGVVEISQLVITQNRVSNAARVAARFGANGGEDEGMSIVALNSVTQTLEMDPARWDIWAVRGEIDENQLFSDFSFEHIYGISNTVYFSSVNESSLQTEILADLQTDNQAQGTSAAGLRFVGTYITHDVDSIIGLDAFPALAEYSSVRALNVMRVTGIDLDVTSGCDAFPIAVQKDIRSVNPPGTGANPFPDPGDFSSFSPEPLPEYDHLTPPHVPDIPLEQAKEGYIFKIQNGSGPGDFGWLVWNEVIDASQGTLEDSLTPPGDSKDYRIGPGGKFKGYQEPGDPTDRSMNIGDKVLVNTGSVNSNGIRNILIEHVELGRHLRVIIWDTAQGSGSNTVYQIYGFAVFKLIGFNITQSTGPSWILAEFIKWDNSCGQEIITGP